jgi:competence protein ComFA
VEIKIEITYCRKTELKGASMTSEILNLLYGRRLLGDEIPFEKDELEKLVTSQKVTKEHGLINGCERCGNHDKEKFGKHYCLRCKKECQYCKNCIMMGKITSCSYLYSFRDSAAYKTNNKNFLLYGGKFTPDQENAAAQVVDAIKTKSKLLIWAVCGAGKTEIIFPGINYALQQGLNICIATPRTDVVHELTPRLKTAFPTTKITSLYGGSEEKYQNSPITISTTHQLLRFYKKFDVLILDEVDAYPYTYDKSLQFAVQNSMKTKSSFIMLTATPPKIILKEKNLQKTIIPKRYHGNPLPIPTTEWIGNWEKSLTKKVPQKLLTFISQSLQSNRKPLIFVPNIHAGRILKEKINQSEFVYSSHPDRKTIVQDFKNDKIKCLISTTILERGVTIPNVDVYVLGADDEIFNEAALVQIAGRVGRKANDISGRVVFFHYGKTNEMVNAINHIKRMNKLGGFQ